MRIIFSFMIILALALPASQASAMDYIKGLLNWGKNKIEQDETDNSLATQHIEEFNAEAKVVQKTYFEQEPISFELRLPSSWEYLTADQSSPPNVDSRLLKTIDIYRGPVIVGGDRPLLKIQAIALEHEILAEHWLQNFIFENGYTQEGEMINSSENESQIYFIHLEKGVSYKSVMKAYIVGSRLLAVRYDAPVVAGEKFYNYGLEILKSFKITDFTPSAIEDMTDYTFQKSFKFSYPVSWTIQNSAMKDPNKKQFELQNIDKAENIKGMIRFVFYNKTGNKDIEDVVAQLKTSIETSHSLRIEKLSANAPLNVGLLFDTAYIEKYDVGFTNTRHNNYELWISALESDDWNTFIYLLTPKKEIDYYEWARNTRAFDLILHSIN